MRVPFSSHYTARAVIAVTLMVVATPPIVFGAIAAIDSMFNAPIRWISDDFPALREFHAFTDAFQVHESILISWPGCDINDSRLGDLAAEIERRRETRREEGQPALIHSVANGYDSFRELISGANAFSRRGALTRLRGILIGPDGETSAAAVALTPEGAKRRDDALALVLGAADETVGLSRSEYRLAGPPVDGVAIDRESIRSLQAFALPSVVLSFVLSWICLRSLWFTLPLVAVAAFGQGVALAAVAYLGGSMNAVLIVLPPLIFVLTISAGVHLVHYYYEERRRGNVDGAVTRALRKGWLPTVLAAITTALGLVSLSISEVGPVRQFGLFGAMGILLSTGLLLLVLPGAMAWWPAGRRKGSTTAPMAHGEGRHAWDTLARLVRGARLWILFMTLLAFAFFGYGLTYVTTTLNVVSLLDDEAPVIEDYRWFQEHLGPLVSVEVVLSVGEAADLDLHDQVELVWRTHGAMRDVDGVGAVISAATFLPPPPRGRGLGATARRTAYESRLAERLGELEAAGYLRRVDDGQRWRISGRVRGRDDIDYGRFLSELQDQIEPVLGERSATPGVSLRYTGVTPVVYEVQRALLANLFSSFVTAVGLVGCVMIVLLRSIPAGLVAMIPNVFPAVVLFGSMGWLGWPVDIGSVMTASVALGIAVDGTFHFLASYFRQVRDGETAVEATRRTYQHCGRALIQTALICAAGLLVFTNSGFLPARSFSWMLLVLLLIAMFGDLVVLPGLLLGPTGRLFDLTRFERFLRP